MSDQSFSSIYTGKEFFLRDHKVLGEQVLPGVTYLEMARAAGAYSLGRKITRLKDITWLQPIKVNGSALEVHIILFASGEEIGYEIYTESDERQVHGQGLLITEAQVQPARHDMEILGSGLSNRQQGDSYYEIFRSMGLDYGESFQGIQEISYNEETALSRIMLAHQPGFVLSPGLLDSALQTCLSLSLASGGQELMLPFSVREISIYQELPEEVWCYTRQHRSGQHSGSYDIELLNASGEVLVQFTELVLLPVGNNRVAAATTTTTSIGMHLYTPTWQISATGTANQNEPFPVLVLLAGGPALLADKLQENLECEVKTINTSQPETFFLAVQEELQKRWHQKPGLQVQVVFSHTDYPDYGFISGLLQTASHENPKIQGKVISVDRLTMNDVEHLSQLLSVEQNRGDQEVRYQSGVREVKGILPLSSAEKSGGIRIKEDGVYLITGGIGGLGQHFAGYIGKVRGTRILLAGRSELAQTQQESIDKQQNRSYYRCDVSEAAEVTALIGTILERYGRLDGIIHSAGVIRDSYILNKTGTEVQEVFGAKVQGAKNIDIATAGIGLDFMVYCSSLAGVFGNAAQADYASANAWLDNYAHYRETERQSGKRHGRTLSINWPLWESGGMQIGAEAERYMAHHYGLVPMPSAAGLGAFETLLNSESVQGIVLYGYQDKLSALTGQLAPVTKPGAPTLVAIADEVLYTAAVNYLRRLLTIALGMAEEKLEAKVHFENYGIDSIQITRLTNRLEEVFGRLPRTLFFEYQNLEELCHYFIQDHQATLLTLTGLATAKPVKTSSIRGAEKSKFSELANKKAAQVKSAIINKLIPNKDIAIIGISGRYPGASNLTEFWDNLKAGKDSITEIPSTRWDMTDFYHEEKGKPGKSYSKWGGFMDDIDKFDPLFFNISPREAELMDPQERLFLQTAWETMEDGGYTRSRLQAMDQDENGLGAQVGVYVGVMYEEYPLFGLEERLKGNFINPGGSPSGIANRVSYFLNLHGPSAAVDTMCSSSLTAIHLACESIQNGSCTLAIAGGVNVSVHPNKYQMLSQGGFASSTGRCESFGEGGDGYVPGEGVGAVLLKPLQQAIADGDRIYGVIKGTAVNHGGKTNGYTVPNPKAQTAVIKAAMKKAGVQAEEISYIEAHGTGTSLGDPIEVAGLSKAFGSSSKQFCSLGSVKSNIGHCESAAGISGLTKVLLQLQHRQLVPSLHSAVLNPNIDFENSPFRVQQELAAWESPDGKPRIAGISGFGAGGSNAHIIIEEYIGKPASVYQNTDPVILILSARDTDRLQEQASNLKKHIETHPEINIHEVAYTLQTGREAMEERLAFTASDQEELLQHLGNYLEHKTQELLTGNIRKDGPGFLLEGKAGKAYLESAVREKESRSLAQLWTKGVYIDWNLLYTHERPALISLPTYAFAKERCWFRQSAAVSQLTASKLHPLLHSNTSNLKEQQFTSIYTGKESFLTNHLVKGVKTLPGVAYLEIARAAAEIAAQEKITQLKDVVWYNVMQVNDTPQTVYTSLYVANDDVEYEIYTNNGTEQLHCHGILVTKMQTIPEKHDLASIQTLLIHEKEGSACYDLFKTAGLEYGSSFRGIQMLYYNENAALSRIYLPVEKEYVLTPGILDSALQTCIGIQLTKEKQEMLLPFSVSEITLYQPLPEELWCYVQKNRTGKQISSYDIDLLNTEGEVLLRFTELVLLSPDGFSADKNSFQKPTGAIHLYGTQWQDTPAKTVDLTLHELSPLIILAGGDATLAGRLQENLASVVKVSNHDTEEGFFNDVLLTVKTILPQKRAAQIIVVCNNTNYYKYGCITGLLKTITQENTQVSGKLIQVDDVIFQDLEELTTILSVEQNRGDQEVRYQSGVREVKGIVPLSSAEKSGGIRVKEDGVYLITGGIGGLGQHFAGYIGKVRGTRILLAGRSELAQTQQESIDKQQNRSYYRCDVSEAAEVTALIGTILERYGRLDGIIHSAGVIRDSYILNKTGTEVQEVFGAKVQGAKNIDIATAGIGLDFMVYCSSLAGVFGNAAQADYASANAWLDNYAHYRETERQSGKRHGRTLSINWPLWESGGMQIGAEAERYMAHHYGLVPMPSAAGLGAFETLLNSEAVQGIVLYGYQDKLSALTGQPLPVTKPGAPTPVAIADEVLYTAAINYLRRLLTIALGMAEEKLEAKVHFENYGIDSIQITRLTNRLEEVFGRLPRTLFFEYQNLEELCHYFIQDHQATLLTLTGLISTATEQNDIVNPVQSQIQSGNNRRQRFAAIQPVSDNQNIVKDIAIIGISGRYPGASNLTEFWDNLKAGKDCITTIPSERWNADEIYSLEKGQPGKSYSKWGGFMDDIDKFDPLFFNISPREAELMDPQERLFLQTVWETIEDAGYTKDSLRATGNKNGTDIKVGVYAGVMYEEYQLFGAEERLKGNFVTPAGIASSIANRVSYFFNFNGPSMAIDTMCSSSLTAIHLACRDMQAGDADIAIAGGVNISVHPNKYLMLSQGRFVSSTGRCESFGEGGDGYVPGEGVGAVLLKPLQQAIADGDRIYGVIKGTAVNHGGKTNGYTVPNPKAQTAVIKAAMKKAGVQAEEISYIEAHGTGTSLGDPIEVAGLSKAFGSSSKQFCSLGSVKSNIGHCESAAGISGLTKVLLQLQHRQLVPSLHSAVLNPNIDFENSPFRVQQELAAWESPDGKPRIAGISGFGAGGSNAHIIIEEYQTVTVETLDYPSQAIIVLSAKQRSRINQQVVNLLQFLELHPGSKLHEVAYTLQTGREAMEERLAFVADSIDHLFSQLKTFLNNQIAEPIIGNIRKVQSRELAGTSEAQKDLENAILTKNYTELAKFWVQGMVVEWTQLYTAGKPAKISLPGYPFVKERYWIPVIEQQIVQHQQGKLHPLLHNNESDLHGQLFTSIYDGKETFLSAGKTPDIKELSASVLLELVREAGERSLRTKVTQMKEVTWIDPIRVNGSPAKVNISVFPTGKDIGYEIFTHNKDGKERVNGYGILVTQQQAVPEYSNIKAILSRQQRTVEKGDFYQLFAKMGIINNDSFMKIEALYYNETEALSKVSLAAVENFILSPGILDSVVKTCMGWLFDKGGRFIYRPVGAAEVTLYSPLSHMVWCHVVRREQQQVNESTVCYDARLLDEQGNVLLRFKNLILQPEIAEIRDVEQEHAHIDASGVYKPVWERIRVTLSPSLRKGKHLIVTGNSMPSFAAELQQLLKEKGNEVEIVKNLETVPLGIVCIYLLQGLPNGTKEVSPEEDYLQKELAVFNSIQELLRSPLKEQPLNLMVFTSATQQVFSVEQVTASGSGIIGLTGAVLKEQPQWSVSKVDLENADTKNIDWAKVLLLNNDLICFRGDHYYRQRLYPINLPGNKPSRFKNGGVYVLLGGAGGIGKTTTAYLVKNYNAQVIWLGRRPLDATITASQDEIACLGMKPAYFQCDATSKPDVERAYDAIKKTYKEVHGLFHSAIVLNDMLLKNMTEADFTMVFEPKSLASQYLVEVFQTEPLDFICFYSSAQSLLQTPGQGNYAAGCSYKDSYALSLKYKLKAPAYVINWGYWGEVGIVAAPVFRERMELAGVGSITAEEGMRLLETVLSGDQAQVLAIKLTNITAAAIPSIINDAIISPVRSSSVLKVDKMETAVFIKSDNTDSAFLDLCCHGVLQVLLRMGLGSKQLENQSLNELRKALDILDSYEQLFFVIIKLLKEQHYLEEIAGKLLIKQEAPDFMLQNAIDLITAGNKEYLPHGTLLSICLNSFPEILTGKQQATEVMFPGGSLAYVSGIYQGNKQSDYFNTLLADIIKNSVANGIKQLQPGEKIRILEVGAGTGGTSNIVFKALTPYKDHLEYMYTDLSRSFLLYAEQHYKEIAPYLETGILNIEQSPAEQHMLSGSYDIVIGANVVHATKNMTVTLSNIKYLLKKDGLLLLNEIASTELFTTLTFGLLDGWWLYEDSDIRLSGSPGLSAENWNTVLSETGYLHTQSLPATSGLSQQIICAKSDGMISVAPVKSKQADIKIYKDADKSIRIVEAPDNNWLTGTLINIAANLIKLPPQDFDVHTQFMDYGFDSILGMELIKNINEKLNVSLKPTDLFSYHSITQMATYLQQTYQDSWQAETTATTMQVLPVIPPVTMPVIPEKKRARFTVEADNTSVHTALENDIAIIGLSGQFGAAGDMEAFWQVLKEGKSLIGEVPADRWVDDVNNGTTKWVGSFLNDIDKFDPVFFKISGSETEMMDPQQRIFLEHCWKAIEDAAINPRVLRGSKCGVYAGVSPSDYNIRESQEASVMWGNSSAILASRISYLLDLKGPAISVDTACSSSLVAMDMGCASLQKGDTDLIIAGGINIMTTSGFYTLASRAGMMSANGKCYTFDKRADGFVPGEGVGVVVLKRLSDAERDGDHIYGIIKASLTNQDGASNGITAPSVLSQQELEKEVYQKFNINPESISYVEAHGTGTSLGDPIELEALTAAFRAFTSKQQYCAIGSAKTNIGHTLEASGMAGVSKILLSLKHKQLPPSLNYEECNPLIDIINSPFKVQQELGEWKTENNQPRRAAISSFGFSGTNVHMVIEEYIAPQKAAQPDSGPAIVVLSAKNAERLKDQVSNLLSFVKCHPDDHLQCIAYTLQVGREAMEERLAVIARDKTELQKLLTGFLEGKNDQLSTGNIKKDKADYLLQGGAAQAYISYAMEHQELKSIAALWVKGVSFNWNLLYLFNTPQRISLPTYSFARQRYWIPKHEKTVIKGNTDYIHPLLHNNTSNLKTLQFTSIFTGKESFLEHHKINAEKILPGVAYLEMARIAGCKSTAQQVTQLKNVAWLSPIHVNGKPETVNIRLQGAGDDVKYEIYTSAAEDRVHNQGRICTEPLQVQPHLNLEAIRSRFTQSVDREKCYDIFRQIGLNYGASFQGIERLYYSDTEALSKVSLPKEDAFALSPGLLDSTLQTCMGLSFGKKETCMELPFNVKEISIYNELPDTVWSYVRKSDLNNNSGQVTNYDVDIVGEQGDILVTFRNFVTLPAPGSVKTPKSDDGEAVLLFTSNWVERPAINPLQSEWDTMPMILLAGGSFQLAENLSSALETEVKIISGETAEEALLNVLTIVKEKMKDKIASHIMVLCSNEDYVEYGYISGFLKTVKIENSELSGKVLGVDSLSIKAITELTDILLAEQFTTDTEVRYEAGIRKIKQIQEIKFDDNDLVKIKEGGVYLIVGGAGGLGGVFTDYINKVPQTKVILIGRSELSKEKQASIAALSSAEYFRYDVSNKAEVIDLIRLIREKYQQLDGVIHCAGVLRDGLIINKTADDVRQVLASKVTGIKNIDEATKEEALDFMVFFSGIAATMGNIGQADYSAANAYMDNYAQHREAERVKGKRKGKTLSINWPFWKDGGMQINTASVTHLENNWGMLPLPSDAGTWAFEKLLGSIYSQGMVVYGHENKIRQKLLSQPVIKEKSIVFTAPKQTDTPGLKERIAGKILEITAMLLKLPVSDIEQDEKLSDYGFDSILLIKYSNEINDYYDIDLTPAIFYNYLTINDLTGFLVEEYREKLLIRHPITFDQEEAGIPVTEIPDLLQVTERYPLSEGQKGLWFIQQLEPANINYNVPVSFIIPGNIDEKLIKESFRLILAEHPLLRSSFRKDTLTGEVYNQINTVEESLFFDYIEINEQHDIKEICWSLIRKPFNLEHDSPVRLFIRTNKNVQKNYILFVFHHIIFDGMSSALFLASFFEKYQWLSAGRGIIQVNEPDLSYFSFAKWEKEFINSNKGAKCLAYWRQKLAGPLPVLALPYDKPVKMNISTTSIGSESIQIDQQELQELKALCRTLDVNMPVMIAGIFNTLLYKLTGQEDLLILMPTAGRPRKEYERSIGYYVNMMVTRNHVSAEMTFNELLRSIKNEFINGMSNAAYPLPRLLADLHIERAGGRETPLKVSFIYQSIFDGMLSEDGVSGVEIYDEVYQETAHIYSLDIQEMHKTLVINLKYDNDMFYAATIQQHLGYFRQILTSVMEESSRQLKSYGILSTEEIHHLLIERNLSAVEYPKNKTLADLFDDQVAKTPGNLAVVYDGRRISYQELNDMANRLANFLEKSGVRKNAPISIVSHKSLEQVWGVLGIAKAGGYYIPIKGGLPRNRINELIAQSESHVVLVQRDYLDKIDHSAIVNVVVLEEVLFSEEPSTHETVKIPDTELAYIIFTSGSTGKPKGVMIDHRGVVNTLYDMNARFKITETDKVFGISDLNFDLSVYDIFGTLACGATLILPLESERLHPDIWMQYVKDEGVTVWNSVPQIVNLLINRQEETGVNQLSSLRLYLMSGDWIPLELPDRIKQINAHSEVFSLGGATEGSIWSIYFPIGEINPSWKSIPYGYPLGNQEMYVLDANLAPCPVNVPGDIYIGGIGVAKGYHKDPEKTAASFIDHPQLKKRLYRTGDLGFQHPGGYMMFLGRQDGQVKINGFRVELGEIETTLQQSRFVKQCVVLTTEDAHRNKRLVAYIVANDVLNTASLQEFLKTYLPDYMVPSLFVEIDKIPLSSNGKVDRNALPGIDMGTVDTHQYEAARDEVEQELVTIWSRLLNGIQVGIHDDFFQVGGNSLTMIQLVHKINTAFNKELQLIEVMKNPTIAQMKTLLDTLPGDPDSSILTLRDGSTQDASFIIPGALGSTDGYYHLATNLPGRGAVYGLQMKGLNGKEVPNSSIQDMAAYNLTLIKSINPIGKISLVAHSYGGIVIYEMLKQATAMAIEVDEVILLDCFVDPLSSFHTSSELDKLGTYFRALLKFSQPGLDEEEAEFMITCMGQSDANKRMEFICDTVSTLPVNMVTQMWKVFSASVSARYKMNEKLDYTITFVQADNSQLSGEDWGEEGSAAGWDQYFSAIKLMNTKANHFTIVNEPYCTEWSTRINSEQTLSDI